MDAQFFSFFLVIMAGVVFSTICRRLHLPWVVALIAAGVLLGPYGVEALELSETLTFMGQIGLVFLMFMAGLETKLSTFQRYRKNIEILALLNGLVPFAAGVGIALAFGFSWIPALLLGVIFMSSSIAVVIPSLEDRGLMHTRLGGSIVAATVLEDVASLVLLSLLLQLVNPTTALPLPLFYLLLFGVLVVFRWLLPKLQWLLSPSAHGRSDRFQQEVRVVFAMLIGTVVVFEVLGLHPIIAGFFAGLVLSETLTNERLLEKLRTISYGIFIPVFFIVVGAQTDISVLTAVDTQLLLVMTVVLGSIAAKFVSGWIGGALSGFTRRESTFIGVATLPQLSTTLAAVFAAVELGLLENTLITAMVALSVVTTFISPLLVRAFKVTPAQRWERAD